MEEYNNLVDSLVFEAGYKLNEIENTDWFEFMEMLNRKHQKDANAEGTTLGEIFA